LIKPTGHLQAMLLLELLKRLFGLPTDYSINVAGIETSRL